MRVLVIAQRVPYPPNKGEKLRTFHQIKYLKEQGHDVFIAAPYEQADELGHFDELERSYCKTVSKAQLGPKLFRLAPALLKRQSLSAANFYSGDLQQQIDQIIQEYKIQVILCSASSLSNYVFKSASIEKHQPKLLMDFMDLDSDKWAQYAANEAFPMNVVYRREARKVGQEEVEIANKFDHCFLTSDKEVELFKRRYPEYENIHTLENGLDTTQFFPPRTPRQLTSPSLLFAGVMDYKPNVDAVMWFMQNVWQRLLDKWPDARFCIAGMNPTDKVKALAEQQGVTVTGFVDDIKPYFDQANIFVAPFRIARGVQNKVLQAFACGLPVVSTHMGAEGIECEDGKELFIANSADEFLHSIGLLVGNSNIYHSMSKEAEKLINEKYDWDSKLSPLSLKLQPSSAK